LTINKFCTSAHQMLNISITACQAKAEGVWDTLAKECPKEEEQEMTSSVTPEDVEKMFCNMAGNKFIEDGTTSKICAKIDQQLNISIPACQAKAEKVWDTLAKICPSRKQALTPPQNDIEGIFCMVADSKFVEGVVTGKICSTIRTALHVTVPECETQAEKVWDGFAKMCPKIHQDPVESRGPVPHPNVMYV